MEMSIYIMTVVLFLVTGEPVPYAVATPKCDDETALSVAAFARGHVFGEAKLDPDMQHVTYKCDVLTFKAKVDPSSCTNDQPGWCPSWKDNT